MSSLDGLGSAPEVFLKLLEDSDGDNKTLRADYNGRLYVEVKPKGGLILNRVFHSIVNKVRSYINRNKFQKAFITGLKSVNCGLDGSWDVEREEAAEYNTALIGRVLDKLTNSKALSRKVVRVIDQMFVMATVNAAFYY